MNDEFLDTAGSAWRRQNHIPVDFRRQLRRRRRLPNATMAAAFVAFLVGLRLLRLASEPGGAGWLMPGVISVAIAPLFALGYLFARLGSIKLDQPPEKVAKQGLAKVERALASVTIGYAGIAVLVGFSTLLWAVQLAGLIKAFAFVVWFSGGALAVSLAGWIILRRRKKQACRERDAWALLDAELKGSEDDA
jgi:hypothetical protein